MLACILYTYYQGSNSSLSVEVISNLLPAVVDHLVFPSKFLRGFIGFFVDDPTRKTKGGRRQLRRRHVNEGVFLEGGGIEIRKRT